MISASVTSRSGPFSRATNCTCIVLLLAIASSSAPSWNGRGAFGLGPGSPPKTISFDLPPARCDPRLVEKGLRDDGRRPTSRPSRRRGRGDEQACQPERSGGNPKGAGAPAQRLGPPRSTRAASKEDGQAEARAAETAAGRHDVRSRRGNRRLNPRSREGTTAQMTTRDAAVGEGPLRGPRGGRARGLE